MAIAHMDGAWTAMVTPFTPDGQVDRDGLARNIEFQIEQGISGLVPTGTTGESPTLPWEEHNLVVDLTVKTAAGRRPVMAGTGSNSTQEAMRGTGHAAEVGADAALLVDCYYNGPSSLELRLEYHAVVAKANPGIGIVPYVIPGRTTTALSVEDLAILASECLNVIAVKEATGDLERMARTREMLGPDFAIMSGDDDLTFEMMTAGAIRADGVVSVMSNIVPGAVEAMVRNVLDGQMAAATALADALKPLFGVVTVKCDDERQLPNGATVIVSDKFRNPLAIKTLMNALGMPAGPTLAPLGRLTLKAVEIVRAAALATWQNDPSLFEPIEKTFDVNVEERLHDAGRWAGLAY